MKEKTEKEYLKIEPTEVVGFPEKESLEKDAQIVVDRKEGKIVKIGNPRDVNEWFEGIKSKTALGEHPPYKVENLETKDAKLFPGLVETHSHPTLYSMLELTEPAFLFNIHDKEKLKKQIKERYKKEKGVVLGLGWDPVNIPDLSKKDLDEVSKEDSIIVMDPSFHGGIANSKGLEILDRLREAREKEIGRNLKGKMSSSGRITEEFTVLGFELAESQKSIEELAEARVDWIEKELKHGICGIHDMAAFNPYELNSILSSIEKWKKKYPDIEFPVSRFFVRPEVLAALNNKSEKIAGIAGKTMELIEKNIVGVKLLADGSIGSYTAGLERPYLDKKTKGIEYDSIKDAKEAYKMAKELGISQIATHAIGDKAIKRAIEYAKSWFEEKGEGTFRIEHFEMAGKKDILKETAQLGIWVSSQPNFITDIVSYEKKLGKERTRIICPHKSIVKANIPMMFGTDGMPQNMLFAIWCATHHPNAKERISLEEAIIASAAMAGDYEKSKRGRLTEGAPADFVVMDPSSVDSLLKKELSQEEIREVIGSSEKIEDLTRELDEGVRAVIKSGKVVKALQKD